MVNNNSVTGYTYITSYNYIVIVKISFAYMHGLKMQVARAKALVSPGVVTPL